MFISYYSPTMLWRRLKKTETRSAQSAVEFIRRIRCLDLPAPKIVYSPLYFVWRFSLSVMSAGLRAVWWTPLFKARCCSVGRRLYLYGGLPWVAGNVQIIMGDDCRMSGKTTITGRFNDSGPVQLIFGNNVGVGWLVTIAVGKKVILGNNVRVANQCFLAGYPGHPVDANERARHKPDLDSQARDIVLEDDVWLGTGTTVLSGVRIGKGSIVGAGSVVTKSLPAGVIAGGNPAKIIRTIGG